MPREPFQNLSWFDWTSGTDTATAAGTVNTTAATKGLVPYQISDDSDVGFYVRGYYSVDFVS